jgi:hypothetical protein
LSAAICVTTQIDCSVDQKNGDNVMWYVLKECSGNISHVYTRVVRPEKFRAEGLLETLINTCHSLIRYVI